MTETLTKALILIVIIGMGYFLKKINVFCREDFKTISRVVLYLTLPCAIITKLNGLRFDSSLLLIVFVGIGFNLLLLLAGFLIGKTESEKHFSMMNITGLNIGNFALPYISYFMTGEAILASCLFDAGNGMFSMGGTYAVIASMKKESEQKWYLSLLKRMLTTVPIVTYLIMVVLSLLSINLPDEVIDLAATVGDANVFLSMLMIGIALEITIDRTKIAMVLKLLGLKYGLASAAALLVWFFLPFDAVIRETVIIMLYAPMAGLNCFYTEKLKEDTELSACVNSLSIVISLVLMSCMVVVMI